MSYNVVELMTKMRKFVYEDGTLNVSAKIIIKYDDGFGYGNLEGIYVDEHGALVLDVVEQEV